MIPVTDLHEKLKYVNAEMIELIENIMIKYECKTRDDFGSKEEADE